jgi:hypothetical protein
MCVGVQVAGGRRPACAGFVLACSVSAQTGVRHSGDADENAAEMAENVVRVQKRGPGAPIAVGVCGW